MPPITAIISDVHANREALAASLECIMDMNPASIICLGDTVGYGPDPEWCVDVVRSTCDLHVCGNHEMGLLYGADHFSEAATRSLQDHRQRLMPDPRRPASEDHARWDFLKQLPARQMIDDAMLLVHGAPANPTYEYLREKDVRLHAYKKLAQNFDNVRHVAFHGHTHIPGVMTGDYQFWKPDRDGDSYRIEANKKIIVNCGSVGAPRDGAPGACFVTLQGSEIRYHRIRYPVETTIAKIRDNASCDQAMAGMLAAGNA